MALFERLRRLIRANFSELLRGAEDPERALSKLLAAMNEQLIESKRSVANAIADQKRLERQAENQRAAAVEWERKAIAALQANNEGLARQALERKQREELYLQQLTQQADRQRSAVDDLKAALRDLHDRLDEAQRKKNLLVARAKRAEAQRRIQEVMTGFGDGSAFDAFEEMAARVDQLEAQTEALGELSPGQVEVRQIDVGLEGIDTDLLLEDLRRRIAADPAVESIDASLEDLKRRMRDA